MVRIIVSVQEEPCRMLACCKGWETLHEVSCHEVLGNALEGVLLVYGQQMRGTM